VAQEVFWTDDRKELVKLNWLTKSNSQIADLIGCGATRCSVSGVAHRMGLRKKVNTDQPKAKKPRAKRKLTEAEKLLRKMPKPPSSIIHGEDIPPLIGSALELTTENCAYPYGDKNFVFCGRPRELGSFCREHAMLCYEPSRPSKRLAESSRHYLRPRYR
jgi:hypothetical protein